MGSTSSWRLGNRHGDLTPLAGLFVRNLAIAFVLWQTQALPLAIMAQAIRAILLASAMAATLVGRRPSNAVSQGRCPVPWIFGIADDGDAPATNRLRR